jgi:uncharacterized protein YndB with AHSA1/START domain
MMAAMKFRHVLRYDATPDEVYAMLADPAFREKVCAAQEVVTYEVRLTPSGDGFVLEMDQEQNTAGLPAIAKKIAGDTTKAVVAETWADRAGGTLDITAPGKPTSASGTITLAADGGGTTETVELEVTVKVPVIGGKLENLMADQIKSGMDVEHTVGAAWLAGER